MHIRILSLLFILVFSISVEAEIYKQVRVFATDNEAVEKLSGFEIVDFEQGQYFELIVDSTGFAYLTESGFSFEVVHENLVAFYQSRYPVITTMGGFRTYAEVTAVLDSLADNFPSLVTAKSSIGQSLEGNDLWLVKVSDNPYIDEEEPEIFINGLHHAREPITVEICIEFIKNLVENYGTDPEATQLIDNNEFYIIPVVNPDGYEYNLTHYPAGGGMWRKNRRNNVDGTYGVDLNRNYPYFWGYDNIGSSPGTYFDTYRGTHPASEPEVQAMTGFVESHDFAWIINFHSYSNLLLWPWGYYDNVNEDLVTFQDLFGNYAYDTLSYNVGTAWQRLYNVNGEACDWGWGERISKRKTYAMTIEVGSGSDGFWPPLHRIPVLVNENILALRNFSHKAYEIYKRRNPPAPQIVSLPVAPANQSFYLVWHTTEPDTFNSAVSYEVVEKSGYQRITLDCESPSNFNFNNFSLSSTRSFNGNYSLYSGMSNNRRAVVTLKNRLVIEPDDSLTFWIWYDIDNDRDYAYVEVSSDGGIIWRPVNGNLSTVTDPNHHNEGFGITGTSDGWVQALYPLNSYAGRQIDIRFRYWTDASLVGEGVYIDDIYPGDVFSSSTILAEYTFPENLLVGPYSAGDYYFQVMARDDRGDLSSWSDMLKIEVTNELYDLSGYVTLDDSPIGLEGSIVTVLGTGLADITSSDGYYFIADIPSYNHDVTAVHSGYFDSVRSDFSINTDTTLDFSLAPIIPSEPVLLSPRNNQIVNSDSIIFDWQDSEYADGYIIQIAEDSLFAVIVRQDSSLIVSGYLSVEDFADSIYYWHVIAYNSFGRQAYSEARSFIARAGWEYISGDANGDGKLTGSDLTYLVFFIGFVNPSPEPYLAGDVNGDCLVNNADITYFISFFRDIVARPVPGDCDGIYNINKTPTTAE